MGTLSGWEDVLIRFMYFELEYCSHEHCVVQWEEIRSQCVRVRLWSRRTRSSDTNMMRGI